MSAPGSPGPNNSGYSANNHDGTLHSIDPLHGRFPFPPQNRLISFSAFFFVLFCFVNCYRLSAVFVPEPVHRVRECRTPAGRSVRGGRAARIRKRRLRAGQQAPKDVTCSGILRPHARALCVDTLVSLARWYSMLTLDSVNCQNFPFSLVSACCSLFNFIATFNFKSTGCGILIAFHRKAYVIWYLDFSSRQTNEVFC